MRVRVWSVVAAIGVVCLLVTGCSDLPGGGDDTDDTGALAELLGYVPEDDAGSTIFLTDWAAVVDATGEDPPEDPDDVADWLAELNDELDQSFTPGLHWLPRADESEAFEEELGFHLGQVDASAVTGDPPEQGTVLLGRFDTDRIAEAVEDDPTWSDRLERVDHEGEEYYSWDDEPEVAVEDPSAARPLGRGGNLFAADDEIIWTFSTDRMEEMLDARAGEDSIVDEDDFVDAVDALDGRGAYTATFTGPFSDSGALEPAADPEPSPRLVRYELVAVGNTFVDDSTEQLGVVALVNDDDDDAEENADRLEQILEDGESAVNRQPYGDAYDIEEITTEGRVTVGVLEYDEVSPAALVQTLFRRDNLFWYED